MEIGLYDVPDQAQLESHPVAADGYDEYIRGAQEAEHMGAVLLVDRLGSLFLTPNPPMDRDGWREDSGRGVRELQAR